jgi:DNA-binding MarR family transcriptional regulator
MEAGEVDQKAYNAVTAAYKVMARVSLRLFSEEGLSESQFRALALLSENGPMLMKKMSDAMFVTPANITGVVDRLEEKKLVRRTASKGDRRATIIEITPEGKAVGEKLAKKKGELIQKALVTFTKDEQKTLYNLLEKFQRQVSRSLSEN